MKSDLRATIPRDGDRISIFGAPGSGKTVLAARAIHHDVMSSGRFALIFDPTGDVDLYLRGQSPTKRAVLPELYATVPSVQDALIRGTKRGLLSGLSQKRCFTVVARKGMRKQAEEFMSAVNDDRTNGWVLFADESELAVPNRGVDTEVTLEALKLVRNRRQRLYLVGQRPQWTSALSRSNATHVCVFRSDSKAFVQVGCNEWGDWEDFAEASELQKFEYIYRGPESRPPYPILHALEDGVPWQ